jgi:hypothetical protein
MAGRHLAAFALAWACLRPGAAFAQEGLADDRVSLALRYSLKNSILLSRLPDDPDLFPDRDGATGFWRARVEPTLRWNHRVTVEAAFEQRLRVFSSLSSAAGPGVLPPEADAPFRIRQLDWRLASASHAEWRGEIDRAALRLHFSGGDVTLGRQAIGWGRGALFGAVDLFAPFTPLEADREWRRGVDAVRADLKLGDRVSLDSVAAFGTTVGRSTFASRLRGYAGKMDLEILGGSRAGDLFAGITSSAAVGGIELHGEFAVFRADAVPGSVVFSERRSIMKAVAGGSYRLPVGSGVLLYAEYHYSGFGATSPNAILAQLQEPAFQERYLRGDTQILGRHALAVLASYEVGPELALSNEWLQNPVDGSGVVAPSITWTVSDNWSALLTGYLPYGRAPAGTALGSEFGASPMALLVQLRMYR